MESPVLGTNDAVTPEFLLRQLRWRYAAKRFDPVRKIPPDAWNALEQSLVLSPSSFGLQPWKFIVVTDPALRTRLSPASQNQRQITEASHLVVFSARMELNERDVERYIERIQEVRGTPEEALEGARGNMTVFVRRAETGFDINAWSARQVYIALGVFLASAALMGIDACPMEGIDPNRYDEILGLDEEGYHVLCVATAGYRAGDDAYARLPKVRFPREDVVERR